MSLLSLPAEIRIKVYIQLTVVEGPILFEAEYGSPSPVLIRYRRDGLCPALLRVNKMVFCEAISLLYSKNRFKFPDILTPSFPTTDFAYLSPFIKQIGSHACLVRHVCLNFPNLHYYGHRYMGLHESQIKSLKLIQHSCTSIQTLEFSLNTRTCPLDDLCEVAEALGIIDERRRSMISLKELIVDVQVCGNSMISKSVIARMREYGWTVEIRERDISEL